VWKWGKLAVSPSRAPRSKPERATVRLKDLALSDRESIFRTPRGGDWAVLALLLVGLAGCGLFTWYRLGPQHDHIGRAIFFGTLLLCAFWTAAVYTFKLSLSARVGPHGVSVVRGPWRTELPWRDVARMTERVQVEEGQRFRWLVVLARDGRRLQIREDLVTDYPRFRLEVFERYSQWRDHGGTMGAAGGGPFVTREMLSAQVSWWLVLALVVLLPGLYFALVLPETGLIGPALIAVAALCALLSLRSLARRHTFTIDGKALTARRPGRTVVLPWREVARVDRVRNRHNPLVAVAVGAGGLLLGLVTRTDHRVRLFDWRPRVPEYLSLRGAGRHIRIALHRLPRPDDLLAWIEFYESVGRKITVREAQRSGALHPQPTSPEQPPATEQPQPIPQAQRAASTGTLATPGVPSDPWAAGAVGADESLAATASGAAGAAAGLADQGDFMPAAEDAWLSAEPLSVADEATARLPATTPPRPPLAVADEATAELPAATLPRPPRATPPGGADDAPASAAAEERFIGENAPRGWGAAAWQQPAEQPVEPEPFDFPEEPFDFPEEAESAEQQADYSTDLAASFAAWRTDPNWQPPELPRFGPQAAQQAPQPPATPAGESAGADQGQGTEDSGAFAQDDFLR
jgi:hypothetical protein